MRLCLVVDDASVIRKVARHVVEGLGFVAIEAGSGSEALDQCKREMPDVILLDWHMPGSDSHELLAEIKKIRSEHVPAILYCVTENDPADIRRALTAGARDFILKPYDSEGLEAKVTQIMV